MAAPKAEAILKCVLPHVEDHSGPFILGIAGPQGSGKSTLAAAIVAALAKAGLRGAQVSLDDFYRTHDELLALKAADPDNKLFRTRGHAGSHDEALAARFFADIKAPSGSVAVPSFDKSAFNGEGDRQESTTINLPIDVLVFEGWCLGFRPLRDDDLQKQWELARAVPPETYSIGGISVPKSTLASHRLGHLKIMNDNLRKYCQQFMGPAHFDYLVQLDATDISIVYHWRIEQERDLRQRKGRGMTDAEVLRFVEGYMPAYELYLSGLRARPFGSEQRHMRVLLNADRSIVESQ